MFYLLMIVINFTVSCQKHSSTRRIKHRSISVPGNSPKCTQCLLLKENNHSPWTQIQITPDMRFNSNMSDTLTLLTFPSTRQLLQSISRYLRQATDKERVSLWGFISHGQVLLFLVKWMSETFLTNDTMSASVKSVL